MVCRNIWRLGGRSEEFKAWEMVDRFGKPGRNESRSTVSLKIVIKELSFAADRRSQLATPGSSRRMALRIDRAAFLLADFRGFPAWLLLLGHDSAFPDDHVLIVNDGGHLAAFER